MDRPVVIKIMKDLEFASEDISNVIIDFCQTSFIDEILCNVNECVRIPNTIIGVIIGNDIFRKLIADEFFWFCREKTKKSGDIIHLILGDISPSLLKCSYAKKLTYTLNQKIWIVELDFWKYKKRYSGTIIIYTNG